MSKLSERQPALLSATALAESDVGSCEWNPDHNSHLLSISRSGLTIEWGPRKPEYTDKFYPPAWVPASTQLHLHSGQFRLDFVVEEMARAQMGLGFMLLWDVGPDWGFFGYLGASSSAWAYDPSTGDVVCNTESIEAGLPKSADGHRGVVSIHLDLPRRATGTARFRVDNVETREIRLSEGAVVLPAACFLKESQRVTLAGFERT